MIGPCPFPCTNKTEFGYCKTTVCLYAPTIRLKSTPALSGGQYVYSEDAIKNAPTIIPAEEAE